MSTITRDPGASPVIIDGQLQTGVSAPVPVEEQVSPEIQEKLIEAELLRQQLAAKVGQDQQWADMQAQFAANGGSFQIGPIPPAVTEDLLKRQAEEFFVPAALTAADAQMRQVMSDIIKDISGAQVEPPAQTKQLPPWEQEVVSTALTFNAQLFATQATQAASEAAATKDTTHKQAAPRLSLGTDLAVDPRLRLKFVGPGAALAGTSGRSVSGAKDTTPLQSFKVGDKLSMPITEGVVSRQQVFSTSGASRAAVPPPVTTAQGAAATLNPAWGFAACSRFAEFVALAGANGFALDIHGYLSHIMRTAYLGNLEDLQYMREKVSRLNDAKDVLRSHLYEMRKLLNQVSAEAKNNNQTLDDSKAKDKSVNNLNNIAETYAGDANGLPDNARRQLEERYKKDGFNITVNGSTDAYGNPTSSRNMNFKMREGESFDAFFARVEEEIRTACTKKDAYGNKYVDFSSASSKMPSYKQGDPEDYNIGHHGIKNWELSVYTDPPSMTAGGTKTFKTKEELETYIKKCEDDLNTLGDDAQLANIDLQNTLQKQQHTLQMLSNISKLLHDTALSIIRKYGG